MASLKFKDENGKWVGVPSIQGEPGPKGDTGPQGIQGIQGEPGPNGKDGVTPTFEVGTVTTGEANVEMTEENNHYTLDFTFPEGGNGGSTIRYIDVDATSESAPLILENLELGVYALKSKEYNKSLYVKAKASNTKALKVDYATHGLSIFNYSLSVLEAPNRKDVVTLAPSSSTPHMYRKIIVDTTTSSGLDTSNANNYLVPESYIGQFIPGLSSGKTNTYASDNVFNKLPTSSATPTEDSQLVNKAYVDSLINTIYPIGCYFETSDTSFNPNTTWGGNWIKENDKWHRTA